MSVLRVTDVAGEKQFFTEPMLIDDFLRWTEHRYGFVIAPGTTSQGRRPITLDEHRAFRENVRALKDRLREIGFYDDLTVDAPNSFGAAWNTRWLNTVGRPRRGIRRCLRRV